MLFKCRKFSLYHLSAAISTLQKVCENFILEIMSQLQKHYTTSAENDSEKYIQMKSPVSGYLAVCLFESSKTATPAMKICLDKSLHLSKQWMSVSLLQYTVLK